MKTMQVNSARQGPVLIPATTPQPEARPGEVLIRVRAASVTPTELLWSTTTHTKEGAVRTGAVPGHEFSGTVAALGANVRTFEVGDEIYGMNDWYAEGATAEFCIALPQNIAKKPMTLTYEASATVPLSALTAWQGLFQRAKLRADERVLVHGGAGAVGSFAVQLAHHHGAYVIATVSGKDVDFVKQLGADQAIDYNTTRFEDRAQNVDVVFDCVGGDILDRSWSILKAGGRMVTIAASSEYETEQRVKDAFFVVEPDHEQLVEVAKRIDGGQLKAFVRGIVPLDDASAAYEGTLKGEHGHGKLVVAIPA